MRQTRNAQNRLLARLREVEGEAEVLRTEIEALQNSAEKTEEAIDSLFSTMRTGNKSWKTNKKSYYDEQDDYEMPQEVRRYSRNTQVNHNHQQNNNPLQNNNAQQNQNLPQNHNAPQNYNYRNNSVSYINNLRNVPQVSSNIEPISHRFIDRTITQACTLLLKEAGKSLHVNELYNLLCAGGMEFKGNNPTISIAVSLNRNRRFRKVAPGTFDLVMRDASQAAS